MRLIRILALAAILASPPALAGPMETNQLVDGTGTPIGTLANPLYVSGGGGGGGGGATGSVTPAGTNGAAAQAVQGITGGVPQNGFTGQYNGTLPTFTNGQVGYVALDSNGRQILSPTVPLTVNPNPTTGAQEQDLRSTQTLNAATLNAAITVPVNGQGTLGFAISGLAASGATLTFEQSEDGGTTWTIVNEVNAGTGVATSTRTTDGQTRIAASGRTNIRFRVSTVGTGTITIAYSLSVREGMVTIASPVLTGQYNSTLPTLASGGYGVLAVDSNGRQIVSPSSLVGVAGTDGSTQRQILTTTTGALEPVTAAAGKITRTSTALTASTSTTIAAANANRVAIGIQCGSGGVSVDETGGALTAAGVGNGTLFIPTGTGPYFTPPVATRTALTAYTATAQTCVVTEYNR